MGIHGVFKEIGPGQRISLAKVAADHYIAHDRPFRLAIDISIWLFQIQAGKGGSNPALRTFYYRLLRLLCLNIHPLFVFDGPNKPLFKRNKKVGGPGVRVASVPEFLAKQLLKQFGFPWHVAPGEAEAECALLQREGIVDAVLSEDVDTLMFGSGMTLKNWTSENTTKTPTHVNVYRARETKDSSGLDSNGMVLVALMSGGDYVPEGIPGCGPKVACDAARAGFGDDLCAIDKKDLSALKAWKQRLQHEVRTNESKFFSRKNKALVIPEEFPNFEVLGYYTRPCISSPEKLQRLREGLKWDQSIDFAALRAFTADAFDWRCLGGAKKFIRNLAPAMLVRNLRLRAELDPQPTQDAQAEQESAIVAAIVGKRNHNTTDGTLEYRICFTPANLVPIDLSIEEEDDEFIPLGAGEDDSDAETETLVVPSSASEADDLGSIPPGSPSKRRQPRPYHPDQPEKLWIISSFLQIGCPLLVEDYEASFNDPKEFLKARRKAKAAARGEKTATSKPPRQKQPNCMPENSLVQYYKVTKPASTEARKQVIGTLETRESAAHTSSAEPTGHVRNDHTPKPFNTFKLPSTQIPTDVVDHLSQKFKMPEAQLRLEEPSIQQDSPSRTGSQPQCRSRVRGPSTTPRRPKRSSSSALSPFAGQRAITSYYSPSPRKFQNFPIPREPGTIDLVSNSPTPKRMHTGQWTQTPLDAQLNGIQGCHQGWLDSNVPELPDTVTKRRKKRPLLRSHTEPMPNSSSVELRDPVLSAVSLLTSQDTDTCDEVEIVTLSGEDEVSNILGPKVFNPSRLGNHMHISDSEIEFGLRNHDVGFLGSNTDTDADMTSRSPVLCPPGARKHRDMTETAHVPNGLPKSRPSPPFCELLNPNACNSSETLVPRPISESHHPASETRSVPKRKNRIVLRESLQGAWKEVDAGHIDAEALDMTGDGSGWKKSKGRAAILDVNKRSVWRKSEVELIDLTGA